MRSTLRMPFALLLLAGALAGCSKSTNPAAGSSSDDESQAMVAMTQDPAVVEDGVSDSENATAMDAGDLERSGLAAIQPRNFWRRFRVRDRRFEFAFSDTDSTGHPTRAVVTIRTHLVGTFNVRAGDPGTDGTGLDSARNVIHKPLDEVRVRRVLLRRVPDALWVTDGSAGASDATPRWRVAAVSGVEVSSKDHQTDIVSVRLQQGTSLDTTITNVLAFIRLRNLPRLVPDQDVTITVTTTHDDDVVALHHGDRRLRLHNNADATYTGAFPAGALLHGLRHLGLDAISHGTLFDDQAPYDSQRWVFPFLFVPDTLDGPPV